MKDIYSKIIGGCRLNDIVSIKLYDMNTKELIHKFEESSEISISYNDIKEI